ncbi:serine/threonine protein phosphatase [Candidatus Dependentiae bacterium]|nr:serine/threonine protein phosphatase [Candidatus Dependentiae bacterium]
MNFRKAFFWFCFFKNVVVFNYGMQVPTSFFVPIEASKSSVFTYPSDGKFPTISSWVKACESLAQNRQDLALLDEFNNPGAFFATPIETAFENLGSDKNLQWQEFKKVLDTWFAMNISGPLSLEQNWSEANNDFGRPEADFFNVTIDSFTPFAQKIIAEPNNFFIVHGDLHGDIFSLLAELQKLKEMNLLDDYFRILPDNFRLVFLGDYVDRGMYGIEVLYTIMRLAIANPTKVVAVRGNHEEIGLNSAMGFEREVRVKFSDRDKSKFKQITRMYDFLPMVLYVGCKDNDNVINYVQCCHGGIEEAYDPKPFLDDQNTTYQLLGDLPDSHSKKKPTEEGKEPFGFMWNDFDVLNSNPLKSINVDRGTGFVYGQEATSVILGKQSSVASRIMGILRAHQHTGDPNDPMMKGLIKSKGVYKLWHPYETDKTRSLNNGLVWTLNVAPDTQYGHYVGFDFSTYVVLKVTTAYKDWTLNVENIDIDFSNTNVISDTSGLSTVKRSIDQIINDTQEQTLVQYETLRKEIAYYLESKSENVDLVTKLFQLLGLINRHYDLNQDIIIPSQEMKDFFVANSSLLDVFHYIKQRLQLVQPREKPLFIRSLITFYIALMKEVLNRISQASVVRK